MTKRITTYEELMQEKLRLQALLRQQKEVIRTDIDEIKQELAPVKTAIDWVSKLTTKEPGNFLLNATSNTIIDLVIKKFLLGRTGWLTRIGIPFLLKNYSSHFIEEHKNTIMSKILSLFRKKKDKATATNGQVQHDPEED